MKNSRPIPKPKEVLPLEFDIEFDTTDENYFHLTFSK